jgi:hypothetical protein
MFQRTSAGRTLGCMAVLLVGCGARAVSPPAENQSADEDGARVTLHVKDMAKLLKLG